MRRAVILYSFLLTFSSSFIAAQGRSKQECPYSSLEVDSIVFYDFEGKAKTNMSIVKKDENQLEKFLKSQKLDLKTGEKFNRKLESPKSYGGNVASCFDPHLGVVYYVKGEIVAYLDICMDCNRLRPSLALVAQNQGAQSSEEGEVYYILNGMSQSFRKYLNRLLKEYNFSHQLKPLPFY